MTTLRAPRPLNRRIARAVARARLTLAFEQTWRALLWPGVVVAGFLAASWFGLWIALPLYARLAGLALFCAALLVSLVPLRALRWPTADAARQRVERRSRLVHRPLAALADRPTGADGDADPLWRAHQARVAQGLARLQAGAPEPRRAERDPFALRAVVMLLLVVSFFWAGPDRARRIVAVLDPAVVTTAEAAARLDAWISPPHYTGRPPVMLTGDAPGQGRDPVVPEGSTLTVRSSASGLRVTQGGEPVATAADADGGAAGGIETVLRDSGEVVVEVDGQPVARWAVTVTPDTPPTVALTKPPGPAESGALQLAYSLEDDYGVVSGRAEIAASEDGLSRDTALVPAPEVPLVLPRAEARTGTAQTIRDLTAHPWAGARVDLTLAVTDAAGQEGRSESVAMELPARRFRDPLARAIVEQRRKLALDRTRRADVAYALDSLTMEEPETHIPDARVYLGLRSAYWRLDTARDRDTETLLSVVEQLWEVALRQEDGDLSLAAEALRRAQDNLARALEGDATDEEIARLMDELRQALNEFMRELAMQAQNMPQMPMDPSAQMLNQQDLDRMLDQMEQMARQGARDMARQMLSQLQNMMENLRAGRMMASPQQQQMGEMLNQLGEMIQRQQELMDETYDTQRRSEQQNGDPGEMQALSEAQQALMEQLRKMMEELGQQGQQGEDGEGQAQGQGQGEPGQSLGEAADAMGEAAGQLGQGQSGQALSEQGRALENLRRGAQSLAQQMQQGQGGPGMAGEPMGPSRGRADPLGRPLRTEGPDFGEGVEVPDQIDAARARRILEELRRRLSDPMRPLIERDYLERLLERY